MNYQLAEINIARMKGVNIDDPIMKEFVDNLDAINDLAEASEGFVWRFKDEDTNNTAYLDPYQDEQIIVNISVWESVETLKDYVYKTFHSEFLRRRKDWFVKFGTVHTAMWWTPEGQYPTMEEAVEKLSDLQKNGPSQQVFDFKSIQLKPS